VTGVLTADPERGGQPASGHGCLRRGYGVAPQPGRCLVSSRNPESPVQRELMLEFDRYKRGHCCQSQIAARLGVERLDAYWPQMPVGIEWFARIRAIAPRR